MRRLVLMASVVTFGCGQRPAPPTPTDGSVVDTAPMPRHLDPTDRWPGDPNEVLGLSLEQAATVYGLKLENGEAIHEPPNEFRGVTWGYWEEGSVWLYIERRSLADPIHTPIAARGELVIGVAARRHGRWQRAGRIILYYHDD